MKRVLFFGCVLMLLSARPVAPATMPVIDVSAIFQITLSVAELSKLVGLNVRDLAVLANIGPMTELGRHVIVLIQQLENERQLIIEIGQLWGVLADEGLEMCTVEARRDWMYQAVHVNRRRIVGTLTNMLALVQQTAEIMQTLVQMAQLWAVITGSVAGLQIIAGLQTRTNAYLASMDTSLRSEQMAKASHEIMEITDALMMDCISQASMADWGTVAPR